MPDAAERAFEAALKSQTDTLLAIALIVGFAALAIIVWRLVGMRQNRITIPPIEPGEPGRVVSRDDLLIEIVADYREQLKVANEFKAESMKLSAQLAERLKEADATNEKLAILLATINEQHQADSKATAEAFAVLNKAVATGIVQATTIRNEAVDSVVKHVDTKLQEMDRVREALMNSLRSTEDRIAVMADEIRNGNGALIAKMNEVVTSLETLTKVIVDLSNTNKETLQTNKETIDKLTTSLTEIQSKLLEILSEIVAPSTKEKPNEPVETPVDKPDGVPSLAGQPAGHPADPGTAQLPADDHAPGGPSVVPPGAVAVSGPKS